MQGHRYALLTGLLLVLLLFVGFNGRVGAAPAPSGGISISHNVFLVHEGTPHPTTSTMIFANHTSQWLTFRTLVTGLTHSAHNVPRFLTESPAALSWVHITPARFRIAPGGTETLHVVLSPPHTWRSTTVYAGLLIVPAVSSRARGVGLNFGLSGQVALQIGPRGVGSLQLLNRPVPWIIWGASPSQLVLRLANTGRTVLSPVLSLQMFDHGQLMAHTEAFLGYLPPGVSATMGASVAPLPPGIDQAVVTLSAPGLPHPITWSGWVLRFPVGLTEAMAGAVAAVELVRRLSSRRRQSPRPPSDSSGGNPTPASRLKRGRRRHSARSAIAEYSGSSLSRMQRCGRKRRPA